MPTASAETGFGCAEAALSDGLGAFARPPLFFPVPIG